MNTTFLLDAGSSVWTITLDDCAAADALRALLPLAVTLRDVNGNEKYGRLPRPLPTAPARPETVCAGDLMLWGDDILVLFYKTFRTPYSYTRLGRLDDVSGLDAAIGPGKNVILRELQPARTSPPNARPSQKRIPNT